MRPERIGRIRVDSGSYARIIHDRAAKRGWLIKTNRRVVEKRGAYIQTIGYSFPSGYSFPRNRINRWREGRKLEKAVDREIQQGGSVTMVFGHFVDESQEIQ